MALKPMMTLSILAIKSIAESGMDIKNLRMEPTILMVLKTSGLLRKPGYQSSEVFTKTYFICMSIECEFRFNYRNENIYRLLLKIIRIHPLI